MVPKKYRIANFIAENPGRYSVKQIAAFFHTDPSYVYQIIREYRLSKMVKSKRQINGKIRPENYKPIVISEEKPKIYYRGHGWKGKLLVLKYECIWDDDWGIPIRDPEPVEVYINPKTKRPVKIQVRYHWIPTVYEAKELQFRGLRPLLRTFDPGHGLLP
jgi:hypothetical protein